MENPKPFRWNADKNEQLKAERGVRFEQVLLAIQVGKLLDIIQHPNVVKYPSQKILIVELNNYVYLVPFVEDAEAIFLKAIIPSRKMTKKYQGDQND